MLEHISYVCCSTRRSPPTFVCTTILTLFLFSSFIVLPVTSIEDYCADDGSTLDPSEIHAYLSRVMYGRRSKADPLWNQVVVAGVKDGKTYVLYRCIGQMSPVC